METLKFIFLAIVQGIGEFLPISSSGHLLVLGNILFGDSSTINDESLVTLSILLHGGTLVSILVFFYKQIWEVITRDWRVIGLLITGSVPTGIIGIVVIKKFPFLEESLLLAGIGFFITAFLLFKFVAPPRKNARETYFESIAETNGESPKLSEEKNLKTLDTMTFLDAFIIGFFQGIAVLPGFSRSGFTISAALLRGLRRADAAVFSFLLAIPVIAGAVLLEVKDTFFSNGDAQVTEEMNHLSAYGISTLISFIVGLISLKYLMKWLQNGRLHYFGYWLILVGTIVIFWILSNIKLFV